MKTALPTVIFFGPSRIFSREFTRDIPDETSEPGCPPYVRERVRGGSSRDDRRRGRGRKEGSKGGKKARLCKQRSQFSRRMLRAASAPPQDPSPSRISFSSFISCPFLPPPAFLRVSLYLFPPCYSALSPLTALNCRQVSPDRRLLKSLSRSRTTYVLLHGGLRHCESVLGRISGFDKECDTTNLREFQVSRSFVVVLVT